MKHATKKKGQLTNFMEQSPYWEAGSYFASWEISCLLWSPKVYYQVHKSPPLDPITIYAHISQAVSTLQLPTDSLDPFLTSPICTTCSAQLIIHDLITWTTPDAEQNSWSSSLCNFL